MKPSFRGATNLTQHLGRRTLARIRLTALQPSDHLLRSCALRDVTEFLQQEGRKRQSREGRTSLQLPVQSIRNMAQLNGLRHLSVPERLSLHDSRHKIQCGRSTRTATSALRRRSRHVHLLGRFARDGHTALAAVD